MSDTRQGPDGAGSASEPTSDSSAAATAAPIQDWLLAILACPSSDRSALTYQDEVNELWCTGCDRAYPIRDGIPVLLVQEARHRSSGSESGAGQLVGDVDAEGRAAPSGADQGSG